MPHDKNGQKIEVGDEVNVRFKVISVSQNPDYCNLTLETVEPMFPEQTKVSQSLNAKQVTKCEPGGPPENVPA